MPKHEWNDRADQFLLEDGTLYAWGIVPDDAQYNWLVVEDARIAEQVLRREVARLALEVQSRDATLHMAVARLGGFVEGAPTHRINFLQRIDELREIERLRQEDPLA